MGRKRSYSGYAAPPKRARYAGFAGKVAGVNSSSRVGRALRRSAASIRAMVVPGYTRASGYYGRFSRSSSDDGELKFFDTALAWDYDTTGEQVVTGGSLNAIAQGDAQNNRIGRKCVIKSIQIRGYNYFVPTTTATASALVNMYLVLDTQANGSPPAATDLFESTQLTTSMLNLSNSNRFRILKRWVVAFNSNAGATTAYNNVVKPLEFSMKCNIPIEFSGTTGVTAEVRSNNLSIIAGAVLQDDKVSFTGTCRLRFVG